MPVLLADGIAECIGPFIGILFFLFITVGGWIMQQLSESNKRQATRRQSPGPPQMTPQQSTQQMTDFIRQAQTGGSRTPPTFASSVEDVYEVEPEIVEPRTLVTSVAPHLSTAQLVDHAAHLSEEIDRADERLERRLHKQFDHSLGALGDSSDAIHEDPTKGDLPKEAVTTREIIDIFRSPEHMREAFIMSEILARRS